VHEVDLHVTERTAGFPWAAAVAADPVGAVQASDHYGVLADLVLPSRPPGSWA
jgi:hypothetical protein